MKHGKASGDPLSEKMPSCCVRCAIAWAVAAFYKAKAEGRTINGKVPANANELIAAHADLLGSLFAGVRCERDRDFLIQEFLTAMGMAMVKYELCGDGVESGREDEVVFDRVH